ncbi:hypothetical protein [Paracoccus rhizosphaerae]|uniref:DUF4145 domain-containing protein n=1 Tax=Paracoccus rhizosphaerae TaxID=1133347 RepID=A0ABV6CNI2_9RHOB|nr:hypothetical protein [Paracoccus rhizosphaerae]
MIPESSPLKTGWEIFAETLVGLVSALAWPALIVFAILFFGEPIKKLISRIKSASIAGNTVDFREELEEVSNEIEKETAEKQAGSNADAEGEAEAYADRMTAEKMNALFALSSTSPAYAVLEAFKYVEIEWHALLETKGLSRKPLHRVKHSIFSEMFNLPTSIINSFDRLRMLRNKAAHEIEHGISSVDAANYVVSAFQMAELLRDARGKPNANASTDE